MKKIAKLKVEENIIKANISSVDAVINAKIIQDTTPIRSNPSNITSATTENKGVVRLAKDNEAIDGTDNTIAITPHTLKLATNYVHEQATASDTWIINHNLNKSPSITIVDSANNVVEGAEKYIDENTIEIYFNSAFKGKAYLN